MADSQPPTLNRNSSQPLILRGNSLLLAAEAALEGIMGETGSQANPGPPERTKSARELGTEGLPDLMDRIRECGFAEEYLAFRDRFLAWRQGEAVGAKGEVTADRIKIQKDVAANRGFCDYPSAQTWMWRRTISYWIAVLFFEGALFFMISSFAGDYKANLGDFFNALTLFGYCGGKVCFFTCCYFMCLEVVNLSIGGCEDEETPQKKEPPRSPMSPILGRGATVEQVVEPAPVPVVEPFVFNPYAWRLALKKLDEVGAGPYPYYTSAIYLTGVLCFTVGLAAELLPCPKDWETFLLNWSFLWGSLLFFLGGIFECIQNEVFTSLNLTFGWWGALLNTFGGLGFLIGAVFDFVAPDLANRAFGYGSASYVLASSIQIIMWKDEQFGLTFFVLMNRLGHYHGPISEDNVEQHSRFSLAGAVMVHVYCWCGAMSTYNFNIEMARFVHEESTYHNLQAALNEFLPCLFVHMMLALASAVTRTPKAAPFKQLYTCCRILGCILALTSTCTFLLFVLEILRANRHHQIPPLDASPS